MSFKMGDCNNFGIPPEESTWGASDYIEKCARCQIEKHCTIMSKINRGSYE